jgi:drug/metabolite transporter (DMT)-like permease
LAAGLGAEKSSRATNMTYSQMLFAVIFDLVIWGTVPGLWSTVGSTLILGSAIYVAIHKDAVQSDDGQGSKDEESVPLTGSGEMRDIA